MTQFLKLRFVIAVLSLAFSGAAWGANALVVDDGSVGTEADVKSNITSKLTAAGFVVTNNVGVPAGSLATYQQIWDIRFIPALTAGDIAAYVTYMAGAGSLFVMGENAANFLTRDNSIVALIQAAGGGTIVLASPSNTVTIRPPFTGPNAITNPFTFLAAGGTGTIGPFAAIAVDGANLFPAIAYGPGSMTNAPAGSLIVVFDVNFLLTAADANSQALTRNLIGYLAAPVPLTPVAPNIPTLSTWAFLVFGLGLMYVAFVRLRKSGYAMFGPSFRP